MCDRFDKLYSRSFYLHHYTQYIEQASFDCAREDVRQLVEEYRGLETGGVQGAPATRLQPVGLSFNR